MRFRILILFLALHYFSCSEVEQKDSGEEKPVLFEEIDAKISQIDFQNRISEGEEKNYFNFEYIYNGGGVAIGDINNDGLVDIYFSANEVENKLYKNLGNFNFEDITLKAGVQASSDWKTGVNMIDVNADGWLDIYVCKSGWKTTTPDQRRNLLFINNQDGTFSEKAKSYGLDDPGFSIHSSFFDYDKDGDLDVYITNHPYLHDLPLQERLDKRTNPDLYTSDVLYQNEGNNVFKNISKDAGIHNYGHSLGIVTTDLNEDGWDDIYICNDYKEPDWLYINQKNGTFKESIKDYTSHVSFFSMGVDIADINNDGLEDIYTTEMLAYDYKRSKTNMASMDVKTFEGMMSLGLHRQYMHNALQLNSGRGHFQDISQFSGTAKTDWSWSCLIEDFDNDGKRDIFVANGYKRDVFDKDYQARVDVIAEQQNGKVTLENIYSEMPSTSLPNFVFQNMGDLKFENRAQLWGLHKKQLTQGAAFGDLDNDGDMDLVLNNLDEEAAIYKNNANNNFINLKLKGSTNNTASFGSKVSIYYQNMSQSYIHKNVRGYISKSEDIIHFGLGNYEEIDSLIIRWPDGLISSHKNLKINTTHLINEVESKKEVRSIEYKPNKEHVLIDQSNKIIPPFKHQETYFNDYRVQVLLPHKYSQLGPYVSVGDINNDGLDDFFVGGAVGQSGSVYLQSKEGDFLVRTQAALDLDKECEDLGSVLFDFEGDGDMDLYVASGGNEYPVKSKMYQDRLYLNDGKGNFTKAENKLPIILSSTSCVVADDFDSDGNVDLFVGGRVFPDHYPLATPSYVLWNKDGKFVDVARNTGLDLLGMVTDAEWFDFEGDGDKDLMVVGEWMNPSLYVNQGGGKFENYSETAGLADKTGWWYSISAEDLDNDGDTDFVFGNVGDNHKFKASKEKPFRLYASDFDQNGSFDVMLSKTIDGVEVPIRGRQCTSEQMPHIANKFKTYGAFADADIHSIIGAEVKPLEAGMFSSAIALNQGGKFKFNKLPAESQLGPIMASVVNDLDKDGQYEIICFGGMHNTEAETTSLDALVGWVGTLSQSSEQSDNIDVSDHSNYYLSDAITGDVKDIAQINLVGDRVGFLITQNDNLLVLLQKHIN